MAFPAFLRTISNRLVADPSFQRWAARIWPLSLVARAQARALFDLSAAVALGQTLAAAIELGLLDAVAEAPQDMAALAARLKLPADGLACLIVAAEGIGLVARLPDGRVALGMRGAAVRAHPGIAAMVAHHRMLLVDLADPARLFREAPGGGALAAFWTYAGAAEAEAAAAAAPYSALMAASQPMVSEQALASYPFGRHRALLDIGGGSGAFLEAIGAAHPHLALTLFDLPAVIPHAEARLKGRARLVAGHFLADPLPGGADLVSEDAAPLAPEPGGKPARIGRRRHAPHRFALGEVEAAAERNDARGHRRLLAGEARRGNGRECGPVRGNFCGVRGRCKM